jgi:FtsZ-interacting cell division protein ZipA
VDVDTWLIVLIVVVAVIVLALLALMAAKRNRVSKARNREQAREHLQEAQVRSARADQQQALAEEQAARARREQAEAQERAARAEQEARQIQAKAHEDRTAAEQLQAKAEKLAPDLARGSDSRHVVPTHDGVQDPEVTRQIRGDGGATRR